MTTITDEQVDAAAEAIWNRQRDAIKGRDGINGRLTWRSMQVPETFWSGYILDARAALTAAAQAGPTVDTTKLNFSQMVNRIARVIDHNDAGSGGSRMDFAKAIAKGVFDLSEAMAVQAGKSSNSLTHGVQYRRKDQIENFDPWHTMAAFDCESAASAYCRKQSSVSWEYRWICLEGERVEPPVPAAAIDTSLSASRQGEPSPEQRETFNADQRGLGETGLGRWPTDVAQGAPNNTEASAQGSVRDSTQARQSTACEASGDRGAIKRESDHVLASAPATPGRADDWQLVPKVPTQAMIEASGEPFTWASADQRKLTRIYQNMIAASPSLPAQSVEAPVCGACGQPWTGEPCGQKDNGHPFAVCYPVEDYRIATLTKELFKHKQARIDNGGKWIRAVKRAQKAEAELAEAKKVIEPFAKEAGEYSDTMPDKFNYTTTLLGHLRAARDLLERNKTDGEVG